jgi:Transposase DDE domain
LCRGMTPQIFHNLKHIVTYIGKKLKLFDEAPKNGRPLKIEKADAITFALYQHRSTRGTKISVYRDYAKSLRCSYNTFVVSVNRYALVALRIIFHIMRMHRADAHLIKLIDATDIPVCLPKNTTRHRTMRGLAGWGHSGKGFYFGLKLTMCRDVEGRILSFTLSPPASNDRHLFKKVAGDMDGIFVGDAGYVSKELEKEIYIEGKRLALIKPQKKMKKLATALQTAIYDTRFKIEFDFRSLKLFHGLENHFVRSLNGCFANIIFSMLSFMLV